MAFYPLILQLEVSDNWLLDKVLFGYLFGYRIALFFKKKRKQNDWLKVFAVFYLVIFVFNQSKNKKVFENF